MPVLALVLVLVPVLALGVAVVPPSGSCAQLDVVRIGHTAAFTCGPMYIAQELGYFASERIKQELVLFQGGSGIVEACVAGGIDGGFVGTVPGVYAMQRRIPITFVADGKHMSAVRWDMALVRRPGLKVSRPGDLRGRTVAVNQLRTVYGLLLAAYLDREGMSLKDVKLVELPITQMEMALSKGAVDAAVIGEPYLSFSIMHGNAELVATSEEMIPGLLVGLIAFSNSFLQEKADVARRYVRAYVKAIAWIDSNPDEARARLVKFLGFKMELADAMKLPDWYTDGHVDAAGLADTLERMRKMGMIEGTVDVGSFVDSSFLPR